MISKILFTAAVIAGVIFLARFRYRRVAAAPAAARAPVPAMRGMMRWLAAAVVLLMISGTALYLYLDWRAATEVLEVRVIDARSGRVVTYEAYRGDVEQRSFRTLDGRRVTLAETERMETSLNGAR